ncbi:MAG: LPS export ABC transporter permease LptG [candidate division Zixibacteria bacterium]|nr:LPS export ABC transporter permease LptG [candidate division Zixibacteria bacterium]
MRILDRYLIRQFGFALIFSLIAFWVIFLVVDLVEHLDKFIDKDASFFLVIRYYFYYTPYILVLSLPVAMLLSSLFSLGQLAKHNELTAMKSAGISLYRILLPIFALSFLISLFVIGFGETIVPLTYQKMMQVKTVEIEKGKRERNLILQNIFVQAEDGRIFHLSNYDTKERLGKDVLVQRFERNRLKEEIRAKRVRWKNNGWLFEDGVERIFSDASDELGKTKPDSLPASPGEKYQSETEKYEPFEKLFRLDLKIEPEALARRQKKSDEMGYFELAEYVKIKKRSGQVVAKETTDLHLKIAFPFVSFIIVLFGAPLAANPKRSGLAIGFAISLFISFVYYTLIRMGQSFGYSEKLPPLLAAWAANILFAILGTILLVKAKK